MPSASEFAISSFTPRIPSNFAIMICSERSRCRHVHIWIEGRYRNVASESRKRVNGTCFRANERRLNVTPNFGLRNALATQPQFSTLISNAMYPFDVKIIGPSWI